MACTSHLSLCFPLDTWKIIRVPHTVLSIRALPHQKGKSWPLKSKPVLAADIWAGACRAQGAGIRILPQPFLARFRSTLWCQPAPGADKRKEDKAHQPDPCCCRYTFRISVNDMTKKVELRLKRSILTQSIAWKVASWARQSPDWLWDRVITAALFLMLLAEAHIYSAMNLCCSMVVPGPHEVLHTSGFSPARHAP